jgi:hypothetical protein
LTCPHALDRNAARELELREGPERRRRHTERCRSADRREQHAFGEHLLDDACAGGPERKPHADFPSPRGGLGEEQVCEVRAPDQQRETDDSKQQHDEVPDLAGVSAESSCRQWRQHQSLPRFAVAPWMQLCVGLGHRVLGLADRHLGPQATDDVQPHESARRERVDLREEAGLDLVVDAGRKVKRRVGADTDSPEAFFGDAHDDRRPSVHPDRASDGGGVTPKAALPVVVAEYGDQRSVRDVVGGPERASQGRAHTENVERVAADEGRRGQFRGVSDHEIHPPGTSHGEHPIEKVGPPRVLLVIRVRAGPGPDLQAIRFVNVNRPEQGGIGQREHGGIRTDAKSEGHDGGNGERGAPAQQACGEDEISKQVAHGFSRTRFRREGRGAAPRTECREPFTREAAYRVADHRPCDATGAAGRGGPDELQDLFARLPAERRRIAPQQQRREMLGGRPLHARTFLARAASSRTATRAVSARSTRAPSRVIR